MMAHGGEAFTATRPGITVDIGKPLRRPRLDTGRLSRVHRRSVKISIPIRSPLCRTITLLTHRSQQLLMGSPEPRLEIWCRETEASLNTLQGRAHINPGYFVQPNGRVARPCSAMQSPAECDRSISSANHVLIPRPHGTAGACRSWWPMREGQPDVHDRSARHDLAGGSWSLGPAPCRAPPIRSLGYCRTRSICTRAGVLSRSILRTEAGQFDRRERGAVRCHRADKELDRRSSSRHAFSLLSNSVQSPTRDEIRRLN